MGEEPEPRLELQVPAQRTPALWGLGVFALAMGAVALLLSPFELGAAVVMPLAFFAVGAFVWRRRQSPLELRLFEATLEIRGAGFRRWLPWSSLAKVIDRRDGVVLQMVRGEPLHIPAAQLPTERARFFGALPPEVTVEVAPDPETRSARGKVAQVLIFWAFLVAFFAALWNVLGGG